MPQKPIKRGIKVWVRSDSRNGYISQFSVYNGRKGDTTEVGLGGNVVSELTEQVQGKNHCLYMDNIFSSVPLYLQLLSDNIYACGTLRTNRKYLPNDLKTSAKRGLPNRSDFKFWQCGNLVATVWQDTKPVTTFSTNWDPNDTVTVSRKNKDGRTTQVS